MSANQMTGQSSAAVTAQQKSQISTPSQKPTVSSKSPTPNVTAQNSTHIAKLSPPLGQFLVNSLLQVCGFIVAVASGIFAVKSVNVSIDGNDVAVSVNNNAQAANDANRIALVDLCVSLGGSTLRPNQVSR